MINSGLDSNTNYQIYTAAFYFIVTTMATVGYGDISGKNTLERIICKVGSSLIYYLLFLLILFSFIKLSIILYLIAITEYSKLLIWDTASKLLILFRALSNVVRNQNKVKKIKDKNKLKNLYFYLYSQ